MTVVYAVCLTVLGLSLAPCLYRIARGPHRMDRLIAFDLIGVLLVCGLSVLSLLQQSSVYVDIAMGVAVLSFTSTLAFAAYSTGRRVF